MENDEIFLKKIPQIERIFQLFVILGIVSIYGMSYIVNGKLPISLIFETSVLLIPCICAMIFLHYVYKNNFSLHDPIHFLTFNQRTMICGFAIIFLISIIILEIFPYRPWFYFMTMTILFVVLFIQLFTPNINPAIYLSQLCCYLLNLIYGVTLKYSLYFGMTDILDHITWSNFILTSGHILPEEYGGLYSHFPIYHILVVIGSQITQLDIKTTLFILMGLIFLIIIPSVYLIVKKTGSNIQISLLTTLLLCNFSSVIFYGTYMVTRSLSFVGFVILLLLIFDIAEAKSNKINYQILLIPLFLFIITVHPVSILQFLLLLAIFLFFVLIIQREKISSFSNLLILMSMAGFYWFYVSIHFTENILGSRLINIEATLRQVQAATYSIPLEALYSSLLFIKDNVSLGIFLFFDLIAVGYFIFRKKSSYSLIFALFSIPLLVFIVPTPFQNSMIMTVLGFGRFNLFIIPFLAIMMSYGICIVLDYVIKSKSNTTGKIVLIIGIVGVFSFSSLIMFNNAMDSIDLYPGSSTASFNNNDLTSLNFVETYTLNGAIVYSDIFVDAYFRLKNYKNLINSDLKSLESTAFIDLSQNINDKNGFFFYRSEEFAKKGLLVFGRQVVQNPEKVSNNIEFKLNRVSKIFSSGSNQIFFNSVY